MSTYEVTRHIRSVVNLGEACEIHGIRFQPVVPFQSEHGVLVSEGIQGDSFRQASDQFDRHLLPMVDALTMVTGAALSPLGGSTLIRKTRSKYNLRARRSSAPGSGSHALSQGPHRQLGPRGAQRQNQYPDALAAGAALVTSGTDLPRDGVLVFYQDWIAIFFDDDEPRFHNHADLESSGWDPCAGPQDVGV
jgi:hypothetical protein